MIICNKDDSVLYSHKYKKKSKIKAKWCKTKLGKCGKHWDGILYKNPLFEMDQVHNFFFMN